MTVEKGFLGGVFFILFFIIIISFSAFITFTILINKIPFECIGSLRDVIYVPFLLCIFGLFIFGAVLPIMCLYALKSVVKELKNKNISLI